MRPFDKLNRTEKVLAWCVWMASRLVSKGVITQGTVTIAPGIGESDFGGFKPEPLEMVEAFRFLREECGFELTEAGERIVQLEMERGTFDVRH